MKVCRDLWKAGIDIDVDSCRKWLNFDIELPEITEYLPKDAPWKPIVILNQLIQATSDGEVIREALQAYEGRPFRLVSNLRKYYPRTKDLGIILSLPKEEDPEFIKSTKGVVDFFLNYLKFEEGVDVEGFLEPLKKLLEKDQNVEEFLRLCGIDELVPVEEFLERVERAVDVFLKAKEQGLDVEGILKTWDELANEGGSRFGYLERAVKVVADEEVGRKFWEEVEKVLGEKGVKVSGRGGSDVLYRLFYLELVNLGENVDLAPLQDVLDKMAVFMKRIRPIPIFTSEDVEKIFCLMGIDNALSKDEILRAAEVLQNLDRYASVYVFDKNINIHSILAETEQPPEKIAEIISKAVREGSLEGLEGEALIDYIKKRLSS